MKVKQLKRKMAALLAVAMVMTGQPSGVLAGGMPGDSGEASTEVTETVSTDSDATQNTEPDGSEIPPATNSTADSGTAGGNGGTVTEIPKEEQETFEVTYQVEPEEGAKVTGDRTVKTGETLEFTVRVNEGYELDTVRVSGDVLEPTKEEDNKYSYEAENIMQAPEVEVTLTGEEKPAFSYEETIDGITVTLTAEEGVLPDGTKAEVKKVSVPKDAKETEEGEELIEAVAFDITLYDSEGNELDNSWAENGSVKVTFSGAELKEKQEEADRVEILHYEEEDAEPDVEAYAPGDELAYEAEHFSMFVARMMAAPRASSSVYVSADGEDTNDGSMEKPYATLAKAVEKAPDGATIYVMSNLTMQVCARYYGKDLTITSGDGGPYILTRGDDFAAHQDSARSTYNPALIEVDSTDGPNTASLVLTNIILDDDGKHEGSYFVQADSEGDGHTTVGSTEVGNTDIVQDGMIATYNGVGTITLGDGAILKNYGGMCAVRLSSGELIMEEGSQIIDDREIVREKGAKGSFGPAGAIWIQGGTLTMNGGVIGGDEGVTMNGRAVYVDSGTANIGGTIQNIKGADAAWQGQNGVAVHLRSHGEATLTETGKITNVTGANAGNNCAIWTQFCNFTTKAGSEISEVDGFQLLHFDDLDNNNYSHEVYFDGTISDCDSGDACLLRSWYGQITFGPNSVIENCSSSSAGGLIYSNNGSHYTFAGTIRNNNASNGMIYLANQSGGGVLATIEKTAHIVDNTGPGIIVNNSSNVTMNGGEISRNSSYGVQVKGKAQWQGVKFIMNGGTIADNGSYGISHTVAGKSLVEINGGTISGNKGMSGRQISSSGGYAVAQEGEKAGYEYTHVAANVMGEPRTIYVSAGKVILPEGYATVNLGRATTEAVDALKAGVAIEHTDWTAVGSYALWIQPDATEYSFTLDPTSSPKKTGLFVAYTEVNPDGSAKEGATVTIEEVENAEEVPITLKGLTANAPYAVMLFNNKEYTLTPDDITIYTGGGQGDETYDDGGFPALTINNSIDLRSTGDVTSLTINGEDIKATDEVTMLDVLLSHLKVTYKDDKGNVAENDSEAGEYTAKLSWTDLTDEQVRINGNEVNLNGEGKLIVRYINDIEGATSGKTTYELADGDPTTPVTNTTAIAKTQTSWGTVYQPSFYINDNEDYEIEATEGISILDDDLLLEDENDNRQDLLEQKALNTEGLLNQPSTGNGYTFDFHYLDLVDAHNGNAWVSASYGTTVYLPYPENTSYADTQNGAIEFKLIHYPELHREYGISGQAEVEAAIEACVPEAVAIEATENGIKFDVPREGFSPFALVWEVKQADITINYVDENSNQIPNEEPEIIKSEIGRPYDVRTESAPKEIKGYTFSHYENEDLRKGDALPQDGITINLVYTKDETQEPQPGPDDKTFTITATAGDHGSISPSGEVEVKEGDDLTFTITPDAGYKIDQIKVDGNVVETVNSYTFENVAGPHTIEVSFSRKTTSGGSSPSGSGSSGSGVAYTVGLNGNWVHMDPNDINTPISQMVPDGATPVSNPEWHQWKFILTDGSALTNRWAFIRNPYAVEGQPSEGWFSFDENGIMNYGWYLDQSTGKWYFLHRQSDGMLGTMIEGWHHDEQDGRWYYLQPGSGEMLLGWQEIGGRWYYFNPNAPQVTWNYNEATGGWTYNGSQSRPYGSMYQNEVTPDGYQVDGSGAWVQ